MEKLVSILNIGIILFCGSKLFLSIQLEKIKGFDKRKERLSLLKIDIAMTVIIILLCVFETIMMITIDYYIFSILCIVIIGILELMMLFKDIISLFITNQLNNYLDENEDELNNILNSEEETNKSKDN